MLPSRGSKVSNEKQATIHEVASMTMDHLREQLKARKLPTTENRKTLVAYLSTYLANCSTSSTSNHPKKSTKHKVHQHEQHTAETSPCPVADLEKGGLLKWCVKRAEKSRGAMATSGHYQ